MTLNKNKSLMKSLWLFAFVIIALIIGCGRMPPEQFWTWTKEDSTKIHSILAIWEDTLKTKFENDYCDVTFAIGDVRTALIEDMKSIRHLQHYWPRAFKRNIDPNKYKLCYVFTPIKDTTVQVLLIESIAGTISIKPDSITRFDTITNQYDTLFTYDTTMTIVKNFKGVSLRYLHFEKVDNNWQFTKMSGGARIFIPNPDDIDINLGYYNVYAGCSLSTANKNVVVWPAPDTTQYGVQRMYQLDSILSFTTTDTIRTRIIYYYPTESFGFLHYNGNRYDLNLAGATTTYLGWNTGWKHLMLEIVPWQGLCKPSEYQALLWSLPIKVTQ
ncbi:MAG: hypothetical protein ABIK19_00435 [candidate division WOR-3 bacterium]